MFFLIRFFIDPWGFCAKKANTLLDFVTVSNFFRWNLSKFWETHAREDSQVTKSTHTRHRRWEFNRDIRFCMSHWWNSWPRLSKGWIVLSTEKIAFQGTSSTKTSCVIHWMVIYPVAMDYPSFEQLEPGHVFLPLRQTISFLLIWNCTLKLSIIYLQNMFKT